jgi:ligand-binding sensor domain-containing protein/HPt (histidine-containing phosphotransfer) domain-containing protein
VNDKVVLMRLFVFDLHQKIIKNQLITSWLSFLAIGGLLFIAGLLASSQKVDASILRPDMLFEQYGSEHGLSQVSINAIVEDKHGFIWVSTQSGLNRFDGYKFKVYKNSKDSNSLPSNYLSDLMLDQQERLWIGTQLTGLSIYDDKTGTFLRFNHQAQQKDTLSDNDIRVILQTQDQQIYIGTKQGIDRWQESSQSFVRLRKQFPKLLDLEVNDMTEGSDGVIWVATNKGLFLLDPLTESFNQIDFSNPKGISDERKELENDVLSVHVDQNHYIWVGTKAGLVKIVLTQVADHKGDIQRHYSFQRAFHIVTNESLLASSLVINDVLSDKDGNVWIATQAQGLCDIKVNTTEMVCHTAQPDNPLALQTNSINKLYIDKLDQLWVGTSASGLSKFVEMSSNFITVREGNRDNHGLAGKIIFSMYESDNQAWIGSMTQGITEYDLTTGKAQYYTAEEGNDNSLRENGVVALYEKSGFLWVGYRNAVGMTSIDLRRKIFKHYDFFKEVNGQKSALRIRAIAPLPDGRLLLAGPGTGLINFDPSNAKYQRFEHDSADVASLASDNVIGAAVDEQYAWLATNKGLTRYDYDTHQFKRIYIDVPENKESTNYIFSVAVGGTGEVWLGSQNGLHRYDPKTQQFDFYHIKDGLPNAEIDSILVDDQNNLWLATNNGLAFFDTTNKLFESYFYSDGLQQNEHAVGAAFKSESGNFYFGGVDGFSIVRPDQFKRVQRDIQPKFVELLISNKAVGLHKESEPTPLLKPVYSLDEISFTYKQATLFALTFSALDYLAPEKVEYEYRMAGLIDHWVPTDASQRLVTFTGLAPGNYELQLRAKYKGAPWLDKYQALKVTVTPPIWQTWWAYTIYVLLVLAYIYHYVQAQKAKIRAKEELNQQLELKVAERTQELQEKTNDIMSMMQNMHQGLFTILQDGTIHPEYAQHVEVIFDTEQIAGCHYESLIFEHAEIGADLKNQVTTAVGCIIGEDELMWDFNGHMLVNQLVIMSKNNTEKYLQLDWDPIILDGVINKLMVTVRDVTEVRALEKQAQAQQKELEVISQVLALTPEKFAGFIDTSESFVKANREILSIREPAKVSEEQIGWMFRNMHTIKGNARTYGFDDIQNYVHVAETELDVLRKKPDSPIDISMLLSQLDDVQEALKRYRHVNDVVLDRATKGDQQLKQSAYSISESQIKSIVTGLQTVKKQKLTKAMQAFLADCVQPIAQLGTYTLQEVLQDVVDSVADLAESLEKPVPDVKIAAEGFRLKSNTVQLLNNVYMHSLRNAVDHGIESAEVRLEAGKPAQGQIQMDAVVVDDMLSIKLKDDGAGLKLSAIRQKAVDAKVIQEEDNLSDIEIANLIFAPGISSADEVTELSGRGVGMDAVKGFIEERGGKVELLALPDQSLAKKGMLIFELEVHLPNEFFVTDL